MVHFPDVRIMLPSAVTNETPGCAVHMAILITRKMLTSAPVSTKNQPPEISSRKIVGPPCGWMPWTLLTPSPVISWPSTRLLTFVSPRTEPLVVITKAGRCRGLSPFGPRWHLWTLLDSVSNAALLDYVQDCWQRLFSGGGWLCLHIVGITSHVSCCPNPVSSLC